MSWDWKDVIKQDELKTEYGVQGTVTISTQEYRDLLNRIAELKIAGQKEHDDWYKVYRESDSLKDELKTLKERIASYDVEINIFRTWIAKDDRLALDFFNYKEDYLKDKEETE